MSALFGFSVGSTRTLRFVPPTNGRALHGVAFALIWSRRASEKSAGRMVVASSNHLNGRERSYLIHMLNVYTLAAYIGARSGSRTAGRTDRPALDLLASLGWEGHFLARGRLWRPAMVGARRVRPKRGSLQSPSPRSRSLSSPFHHCTRRNPPRDRIRSLLYANLGHPSTHHLSQGCTIIIN